MSLRGGKDSEVTDGLSSCRSLHALNLALIWSGRYVPHLHVENCVRFPERFLSCGAPEAPFLILY